MSERTQDSRISRVRSRLYASLGTRVAAYAGVMTGFHMAIAEQGLMTANTAAGLGLSATSIAGSIIERRLAHRHCADLVEQSKTQDFSYVGLAKTEIANAKRDHSWAYGIGMGVAPFAAVPSVDLPNPELARTIYNDAILIGLMGAVGIVGGVGLDVLAINSAVDGYTKLIQAQQAPTL